LRADCPALVVDAASSRVFVGILTANHEGLSWQASETSEAGAVEQLFSLVQGLLSVSAIGLSELRGLLICEGPGNLLGLRTAVLAAETWRACGALPYASFWRYSSLGLMQHVAGQQHPPDEDLDLLLDWRRGHWFHCQRRAGAWMAADTVSAEALTTNTLSGKVYHIRGRGNWPPPPHPHQALEYQPLELLAYLNHNDNDIAGCRQYQVHGEPVKSYPRWSGQRHGA
jgi:tRNA A37 threonylcarbamoyladenosine modification protein TsaB